MQLLTEKSVLLLIRTFVHTETKYKSEIVAISISTILHQQRLGFVFSDTVPNKVNDIKVNFTMFIYWSDPFNYRYLLTIFKNSLVCLGKDEK